MINEEKNNKTEISNKGSLDSCRFYLGAGDVSAKATPELYNVASKVLDRVKLNQTLYVELNREELRALGFGIDHAKGYNYDSECLRPHELECEEVYSFFLDPIVWHLSNCEYLGQINRAELLQKRPELLAYQRNFMIARVECDWEKTTQRMFKKPLVERRHREFIAMDSPLPDPKTDSGIRSFEFVGRKGEIRIRRKEIQSETLRTQFVTPETIVYPLYQKDLDELVEVYEETKRYSYF